jgi:hypothetical protein
MAVRQADSRTKVARWQVCSRYEESAPGEGGALFVFGPVSVPALQLLLHPRSLLRSSPAGLLRVP